MLGLKKITNRIKRPSPVGAILMYHHIRHRPVDPWETCVSEAHFKAHLEVLKEMYDVLPLSDFQQIFTTKTNKRKKIFITFDDGYRDNYESAVPELNRKDFSATFFIPTQILSNPAFFWWEIIDHLFWEHEDLPEQIHLNCGNQSFDKVLPPPVFARQPQLEKGWSANNASPPSARCHFYLELCSWIKERTPRDQQSIARQLLYLCKKQPIGGEQKMTTAQICQLPALNFEIGAHTIHHPALGLQSYEVQQKEIADSKSELEKLTGIPVIALAYPHGHYNSDTQAITRKSNFQLACTTEYGYLSKRYDPFALPRVWVKDIDGPSFGKMLSSLFKN